MLIDTSELHPGSFLQVISNYIDIFASVAIYTQNTASVAIYTQIYRTCIIVQEYYIIDT